MDDMDALEEGEEDEEESESGGDEREEEFELSTSERVRRVVQPLCARAERLLAERDVNRASAARTLLTRRRLPRIIGYRFVDFLFVLCLL